MKVVIVAKTRKGSGACVGGLTFDGRSVRLVHPQEDTIDQFNMEYEVGDVWDVDYRDDPALKPPHVENILVTGKHKLPPIDDVAKFALGMLPARSGGIEALFEGLTRATNAGALYVAERIGVPSFSTMFWQPDKSLVRDDDAKRIRYRYPTADGGRTLTFVGFQEPVAEIPAGTPLRVSLAHWWRPKERPEAELRCYVQLSGWFMHGENGYGPEQISEPEPNAWPEPSLSKPTASSVVASDSIRQTLLDVFGYNSFREPQEAVITSVLSKRDTLAIMPTGSGKSLCYQLPALHFSGLTVVVSPLISLMEDQVVQLHELGIPAAFLNSTLAYTEDLRVRRQIRNGEIKLLYAAPETLVRPETLNLLQQSKVDCLTIDEAHCISEWGHDFRPEYRQLVELRERLPQAACLAVTATATARVREDIKQSLHIGAADEYVSSFNRENLFLTVDDRIDGLNQTIAFLKAHKGEAGIIYCTTRNQVDELAAALQSRGWPVLPYHAGLDEATRRRNQQRFRQEEGLIIVATIAFGMGINKSNVRFVLHHDLPSNLESYYQQIGRAGRDGLRADCLLLFDMQDTRTIRYFISQQEVDQQPGAKARLEAIVSYAETAACRRKPLLAYFSENYPAENCGWCDNCLGETAEQVDLTVAAQKFLSCVKRTGQIFGASHIIAVLRGSRSRRVLERGHDRLSTYDIGREYSRAQWQHLSRQFLRRGLLAQDADHGGVHLTQDGVAVLRGQTFFGQEPPKKQTYAVTGDVEEYDRTLFDLLRRKRSELATDLGVPPYVVVSDWVLVEMARRYPTTDDAFIAISGIGRYKLEHYGEAFMDIVRAHVAENQIVLPTTTTRRETASRRRRSGSGNRTADIVAAFNQGLSLAQLAESFGIKKGTIITHIERAAKAHGPIDITHLDEQIDLPPDRKEAVLRFFSELGSERLAPIYEALEGSVSYEDLRLMRIVYRA